MDMSLIVYLNELYLRRRIRPESDRTVAQTMHFVPHFHCLAPSEERIKQ